MGLLRAPLRPPHPQAALDPSSPGGIRTEGEEQLCWYAFLNRPQDWKPEPGADEVARLQAAFGGMAAPIPQICAALGPVSLPVPRLWAIALGHSLKLCGLCRCDVVRVAWGAAGLVKRVARCPLCCTCHAEIAGSVLLLSQTAHAVRGLVPACFFPGPYNRCHDRTNGPNRSTPCT